MIRIVAQRLRFGVLAFALGAGTLGTAANLSYADPAPPNAAPTSARDAWILGLEAETNDFFGPEMAKLCAPGDDTCEQPVIASVMCDISQMISCRTIARAVRRSTKLYLLYPFRTTEEEQALAPDVTLFYSHDTVFDQHTITFIPGDPEFQDMRWYFSKTNSKMMVTEHPDRRQKDIFSGIYNFEEGVMKSIEFNVGKLK